MKKPGTHIIYTIGHSTHSLAEFLDMLQSFDIKILADIRSLPGSRKFPQFDKENLKISLEEAGIQYWNNDSFRGFADYMETEEFESAILKLEHIALEQPTAYMCSEAVWWRCHRSMVSDYLKAKGWTVLHIMVTGKVQEHKYTAPARIVDDNVFYSDEN